ncbi:long-chain-fatty-acid--CoA ligase [Pseudonocardia sp. RS11V-5]|uniref:class I adenylate-forming enzyme family protein n=1 Tax=Pseudonocardia terrae TaxID=2905831 RepID=UPI001E2B5BE2|nr:long-chain-fatty-acid--CoA ligase [Pseudonocardia terrae]MCE3551495.1 long-chain-fatty-acid--CoA ligase [Pseudonocardia terrae]
MSVNYAEQVRRHAVRTPKRTAVVDGDREVSWAELDERATRIANGLAAAGVVRGDRVALLVDNSLRPLEVMIACARAGFVHVPLDFRLAEADVRSILADCGARAVIVDTPYLPTARRVRPDLPDVAVWVTDRAADGAADRAVGFTDYDELVDRASTTRPAADVDDHGLLCILYTSGTTGRAKGVTATHLQSLDNAMGVILGSEIDGDTRYAVSYPHGSAGTIHHVWGPVLLRGGCLVLSDVRQFSAERFFALVERHRVTHCQLVPTMVFRLLDHPDRGRFDLSSLRTMGYASAPIPPERVRHVLETFGPILVQMYGMTETASHATILGKADHVRAAAGADHLFASCGRPAIGAEIRILDDDGRPVPTGEVGEIVMRARWFTSGYWNDPERTAEALRDGWLYSGDLGRMDAEEYLYVVDRKKDLIITGGANVASTEVEAALYDHPAVQEAAVIGRPDREWGEAVHAVVSLRPDGTTSPAELIAWCRERLAHFKCPKSVEIRAELPRTSTGKLAKAVLRAELTG